MLLLLALSFLVMHSAYGNPDYVVSFDAIRNENLEEVFVQRWAWFSICDHAYANLFDGYSPDTPNATPFNPEDVKAGDTIFSTSFCIEKFFTDIHPQIKHPYILVTIFTDSFPDRCFSVARYTNDPKIIAWFGTAHTSVVGLDKFTIVPMGILRDERLLQERKKVNTLFKKLRRQKKNKLLYMNFTRHDWMKGMPGSRYEIYDLFKDEPFCMVSSPKKSFFSYIKESASCKFVLSPEGDTHDCYRHWEAILTGSIPVVHSSPVDKLFEDLPVVIVDDYKQVTEEFLEQKYKEMSTKKYNLRKLYMQYWVDKINETKARFFAAQKKS